MKTQRSILPLFSGSAPNTNPLLDPNISTAYTELSPNLAMATLLTDIVDSANLFDAQGLPITITSLNGIAGINNFTNTLTYWENITISPLPSASNFTILGMVYIDGTNVNRNGNILFYPATSNAGSFQFFIRNVFSSGNCGLTMTIESSSGVQINEINIGGSTFPGTGELKVNQWYIYALRSLNSGATIDFFINGISRNSINVVVNTNLQGTFDYGQSCNLDRHGDLYMYNTILSNTTINLYANYLATKYALTWIDI